MCILTFVPEGVQPDAAALTNGADNNPDGHGFAIVDRKRNRITVRRHMEPGKLIDEFIKLRKKLDDGPALFHSRIATAGLVDKSNCHPFRVGRDSRTVVAHNGVLPREAQPVKGDLRSDTRIFAEQLLPQRNFDGRRSMKKLAHWLGGDKIIILTVNPKWKASAYLVNSSRGEWDKETGIWYSNQSYRDDYNVYRYYGGKGTTAYTSRKCENFDHCGAWTYMDRCFVCRGEGDWGWGRPLALESGTNQIRECLEKGCETRSAYNYCLVHDNWSTPSEPPQGSLHTRSHEPCVICQAKWTVSTVTHVCTVCLSCQDCLEEAPGACLCYTPSGAERQAAIDSEAWVDALGTVIG